MGLSELAKDWGWLFDLDSFTLLSISPFGDLFLQDESGALCLLDINVGEIEYASLGGTNPVELFPIAFDDRMASGYRDAGLNLSPGTCYGYKIQLVTGGSFEPENVYVATLTQYVSFMGYFHHQIQDVANGESVIIKVVRPPLN
jgi:Domain of unknown function (DUF1851)